MITGKFTMSFEEENVAVDANICISNGLADKAFIIDTVCQALQLEGIERSLVLAAVATRTPENKNNYNKEETENNES